MKTVTTEAQDRATLLITVDETSNLRPLSGFRYFFTNLNGLEKTRTIGCDTRFNPML